jgi:type I restriction enzyme R subunit
LRGEFRWRDQFDNVGFYSFGCALLRHLQLDRDTERVKFGDEVDLKYYRLQRIYSGEITLSEGEPEGVKSPTDVGTGKPKDEKNERFATSFTEEDRLFFEQIRQKASKNQQVIQTALANPFDKFQLGIRHLVEEFMVQRLGESDKIVTAVYGGCGVSECGFPDFGEGDLRRCMRMMRGWLGG